MNALRIFDDPFGHVYPETGERSQFWSASDVHSPARTLKELIANLLETGWPLSTKVMMPCEDKPTTIAEVYKKEFNGKLPKNFARFQREARVQQFLKDHPQHGR